MQTQSSFQGVLIDQTPDTPLSSAYRTCFGSMARAYEMIGYRSGRDQERIALNKRLRGMHPKIIALAESAIAEVGGTVVRDPKTDLLTINNEMVVSPVLARCQPTPDGRLRWCIRFDPMRYHADVRLAVRLDPENPEELNFYLQPRLDLPRQEIRFCNRTTIAFEAFRFEDLDVFLGMAERVGIRRTRQGPGLSQRRRLPAPCERRAGGDRQEMGRRHQGQHHMGMPVA